ncbi:MAG TPA: hypothetical protein VLT33_50150 [Labilithrix sp.]|nr:hypothetical protein [Labilithrix sp.]
MGDPRALPGFGLLDLDLEDDADGTPPRGTPVSAFGDAAFGDGGDFDAPTSEELSPPSTSRVFGTQGHPTRRSMGAVHDASTRVVEGDVLAAITSPPPAEGSGSGVASRDGRVAAMRELYARGDAEGALALAGDISDSLRPGALGATPDHPDASVFVEYGGESSIDLSDPFGGLIPLDDHDDHERGIVPTVPRTAPPCAAPHLSLTERHSIPRSLKSMAEIAKLPIDHRAGFLLAHVDGMHTLEELLDVCAMPATEALALIAKLKEMGVIEFE